MEILQHLQQGPRRWLITGCAGFIGMHVAKALLEQQVEVLGIDNLNDYYDPELKNARLAAGCPLMPPALSFLRTNIRGIMSRR